LTDKEIKIEMKLKPDARKIFKEMQDSRFVVIVAGRRYGKTHLITYDLIWNALKYPNYNFCYVAPTYKMSKNLLWNKLLEFLPKEAIKTINKTDLLIRLWNNSTISIYGAKSYDSIRGEGFHFVYLDEAAYIPAEAWTEVLRQTIATTEGKARFISTPNGKSNWFYDLFLDDSIKSYQRTSLDGGWVPAKEIESAKKHLDEKTFRQEYLASFESTGNTVYYVYSPDNYTRREFDTSLRTILAWDFNINPLSTIIIQEFEQNKWAAVKEFVIPNQSTQAQCEIIKDFLIESNFTGDLEITGDHTGHSFNTKAARSDYNIIEYYFKNFRGYRLQTKPTRRQKDRVNATNGMFRNFNGEISLFVNPAACPKLDKDLKITEWKPNGSEINKSEGISDPSDALSYFPFNYYPILTNIEAIIV
jgi:hypothetical protein